MVRFPNTMIELWEYTESHEKNKIYDDPLIKYVLIDTVPADMQIIKTDEDVSEQGKKLKGQYFIIVDCDVPVKDTMIIREAGKKDTYAIVGEIEINNHLKHLQHKRFKIQHERIEHKLGEE